MKGWSSKHFYMILLLNYPFSALQGFTSWGEYITQSPLAITPQWISSWRTVHMINLESPLPLSNCRASSAYHASFIFTWTNGSFRQKVPTFYFYWLLAGGKKKTREKEGGAQPPAAITDIPMRGKKGGVGSEWLVVVGSFLEGETLNSI